MKGIPNHVVLTIAALALAVAAFDAGAADSGTKPAARRTPHVEVHLLRVFAEPAAGTAVFDNHGQIAETIRGE